MYLGIEIGGTKLQLGVGAGDGSPIVELRRLDVDLARGGAGIREQIASAGRDLLARHDVAAVGFGFGGPIDLVNGRVVKSHQVEGWDDFPIVDWCRELFGKPVALGNDCDVAALAEARGGAGRGRRVVFYVTVGTGIGGGLVVDGRLHQGARSIAAEIGHLRPGLECTDEHQTVEAIAAGPGIVRRAVRMIESPTSEAAADAGDLRSRCAGEIVRLTGHEIAAAARSGNRLAASAIDEACRALGWAIAQVATLIAPEVVVIGGGVSLMGEDLFFAPIRRYARQYVFGPLRDGFEIVPAALGEEVVVHGALALARLMFDAPKPC